MTDDGGLLGWLAESWHRTMIACGIWEVLAIACTAVATRVVSFANKNREWRTQINQVTGMRTAGMRNFWLGWGIFFSSGPVLTGALFTGWKITQWLGVHTWVLPVTVTAALVGIGVVAWRTRGRWQRPGQPELAAIPAEPEVEWVTPQYDMPYGQWSGDEQVIR